VQPVEAAAVGEDVDLLEILPRLLSHPNGGSFPLYDST
jgi:hypothetical protein